MVGLLEKSLGLKKIQDIHNDVLMLVVKTDRNGRITTYTYAPVI